MTLSNVTDQSKYNRIELALFILLFAFSFLNPILRVSVDNPFTAFRVLSPFFLIYLVLVKNINVTPLIAFLLFLGFGCLLSEFSGYDVFGSLVYSVHYLYLVLVWIFVRELNKHNIPCMGLRLNLLEALIMVFLFAIFALFFINHIASIKILSPFDYSFYHSTFFKNVNELGAVLAASTILVALHKNIHWAFGVGFFLISFFINYFNDSKASLLAMTTAVFAYICLRFYKRLQSKLFKYSIPLVTIGLVSAVFILNPVLQLKDGPLSARMYVTEPIRRILYYEPYGRFGSVYDRTDVAVYAIHKFKDNFLLGLGLGHSMSVFENPLTSTPTAKSLHNFILEWIIELAPLSLFLILFVIYRWLLEIRKPDRMVNYSFVILIVSMPLLSVTQSSSYVSNFFFWTVVFTIIQNYFIAERTELTRN